MGSKKGRVSLASKEGRSHLVNHHTPEDDLFESRLQEILNRMLSHLTQDEAQVIRMYFGFEGECSRTMAEIAVVLDLSLSWVGTLKARALLKMREHRDAELLNDFWEPFI